VTCPSRPCRLSCLIQIASRDLNVRPRQLIGRTALPCACRGGLICKILATRDRGPRSDAAIVVGSCRHARSQWTAAHAILHLSTCGGLPAKTDSIPRKRLL